MQQDTVLQHSRMFGYRDVELLAVTRFYTTERIHSDMEKITEIDMSLREDIEKGMLGNGVYFITNKQPENKGDDSSMIIAINPTGAEQKEEIEIENFESIKSHNNIRYEKAEKILYMGQFSYVIMDIKKPDYLMGKKFYILQYHFLDNET
jgi:hypothetical protein